MFEFRDYKDYLRKAIEARPNAGRGLRLGLAKSIGCPVSHISQVLNGNSHFSMEQAEGANEFFGHTDEEANFFLLLLQLARAGSPALRKRLEAQLDQLMKKRMVLKDRLGVKEGVSEENQAIFYSSWLYGAIHVAVTIEKMQTKEAIARYFGLSLKRAGEILEFLAATGLISKKPNGNYVIGTSRIHLAGDSPLISKFHTNWRMRAIQSLEKDSLEEDLHYSSVITLSEADAKKIKSDLVKAIAEAKAVIKDSKEEGIHSFSLDFFRL